MTIQHILVPVDFSESTDLTLRHAVGMAKKFSARLTLYHVFHMVRPPINVVPGDFALWYEDSKTAAETRLKELTASVADEIQAAAVVDDGVPWDAIVKRAAEHGHDHIVMATHGRTGLKHVLLGSVAERVIRHAPCSVTVVRKRHQAVT